MAIVQCDSLPRLYKPCRTAVPLSPNSHPGLVSTVRSAVYSGSIALKLSITTRSFSLLLSLSLSDMAIWVNCFKVQAESCRTSHSLLAGGVDVFLLWFLRRTQLGRVLLALMCSNSLT